MTDSQPPRFLGGYGPAMVIGLVLLLVAAFVPSVTREEPLTNEEIAAQDGPIDDTTELASSDAGTTIPGTDTAGAGNTGRRASASGGKGATGAGAKAAAGKTVSCGGQQVPGDPYSPPCYKWGGGDNGGATYRGVTADKVIVTMRAGTFDKGVTDAISKAAMKQGASNFLAGETPELINATLAGVVDYFNTRYQFYGRKLELRFVNPKGDMIAEVLGGGQEGAEADAIQIADEVGAFADLTGISPPYSDALSRRKVIAIGAPYMSQNWINSRRPYIWSGFTDCDTIVKTVASYYNAKLGGKPAAYARGDLKDKPRRTAFITPDSDWYQECIAAGMQAVRDAGFGGDIAIEPLKYKLDINDMAPQAYAMIPQLVSNGITTVVCGCDPLTMLFLTTKMKEQNYRPEWVGTGVAFTDQDAAAQIFDQDIFNGAFGVSFAGESISLRGGPGYNAFKSVRPNETPSMTVEALFYQIQLLAVGIQMAGPNLTPETFEDGMFKYPKRAGPAGTWDFGPGDYTTAGDAREVFYSSTTPSTATGGMGAWVDPSNGTRRYRFGEFPSGEPAGH